jgi:hypothetical protein
MDLRALRFGLLLVGLAACVGGQSGTESGGGQKNIPEVGPTLNTAATGTAACACALSEQPGVAARGTVIDVATDGGRSRVRVRVSELLGEGPVEPELRFAVGDEIGGSTPELGCSTGPELHDGEDVGLVHVPGNAIGVGCPEYQSCLLDRCADLAATDLRIGSCDQDCKIRTRGQCATHGGEALLDGTLLAAPWDDELLLPADANSSVATVRLPRSQLPLLLDGPACAQWLQDQTGASPTLGNDDGNGIGDGEDGGSDLTPTPVPE